MSAEIKAGEVRFIPIDQIEVLNTRERNQEKFAEVGSNIVKIGLKKPITVTPRQGEDGAERYLLVCGEGRLQTFRNHGEKRIPAMVVEVTDEEAFLMSLAENIARRRTRPLERLASVRLLRQKGYSDRDIATKTGLSQNYVDDILRLAEMGEERLIVAVEKKQIPLSAALQIVAAGENDKAIQHALQEAYESGELRGRQLIEARRVIQRRNTLGRTVGRMGPQRKNSEVSSSSLVRAYQKEVKRQQLLVRKAAFAQQRLLFVVSALKELYHDENFVNLLRAEGLDSLPRYLADRVVAAGGNL